MRNYFVAVIVLLTLSTVHFLVTIRLPGFVKYQPKPSEPLEPTRGPMAPIKLVVSTNKGFWNFFLNWFYHAEKIYPNLLDMLVVVAKDEESRTASIRMGVKHVYTQIQKQETGSVRYGDASYVRMVSQRPRFLLALLEMFPGHNLMYTDVDTVLLDDITRFVDNRNDFTSGIEIFKFSGFKQYYCTGVLFIKNTKAAALVLETWRLEMEKKNRINQPTFNKVLYSARHNVTFDGFDYLRVMSGNTAKRFKGGPLPDDTVLVHANYIQGAVEKAEFLYKHGLWKRTGNTIVSVCTSSRSTPKWTDVESSDLWRILINSINKITNKGQFYNYDLKLYVAFDDDDTFWLKHMHELQPKWDAISRHPLTVVPKVFKSTDTIPWNNITLTAYHEGSDYFVRLNDDTEIQSKNWVDVIVRELKTMDNFGVVGPKSREGNKKIMTHDAVHRTHIDLFGYYYPPFKNWYIDNWISFVYQHRTKVLKNLLIKHHISPTRYSVHTPDPAVYSKIISDTSEIALAYPIEKRVAIFTNGNECSLINDGQNMPAIYFDDTASVDMAYKDHFPTYFVVCRNDTLIDLTVERSFKLGSIVRGAYYITHSADYMLYGRKAIVLGPEFKNRTRDRFYRKYIQRY